MQGLKPKILVVDDDKTIHILIKETLEESFEFLFFSNGVEALESFNSNVYDFIITDWDMPVMNGLELVKHLKKNKQTQNTPIIMMTGLMTSNENLLEAYNAGVTDFIRKPFDILELKARANAIYQLSFFYKQQLEQKNFELMVYTLRLAEINELFFKTIEKCKKLEQETDFAPERINNLILKSTWRDFQNYFSKIYPNFSNKLISIYPNLTANDIKLACLLKLNLRTKEICALLHLTNNSVKVARSRLRKRMNLNTDQNLISYIASL